jgi:hypothetical protein
MDIFCTIFRIRNVFPSALTILLVKANLSFCCVVQQCFEFICSKIHYFILVHYELKILYTTDEIKGRSCNLICDMSRVETSLGSCLRFMRICAKDLWLNVIESLTVVCGEMGVVLRLKWLLRRGSSCIRQLRENASYSFYSCTWAFPPTITLIVQKWLNILLIFR